MLGLNLDDSGGRIDDGLLLFVFASVTFLALRTMTAVLLVMLFMLLAILRRRNLFGLFLFRRLIGCVLNDSLDRGRQSWRCHGWRRRRRNNRLGWRLLLGFR